MKHVCNERQSMREEIYFHSYVRPSEEIGTLYLSI